MSVRKWWKVPLIISGIAIVVITMISILLVVNNMEPLNIDLEARDFFYDIRGEKGGFVYWIFRAFTEFGYIYVMLVMSILLIIYTKFDIKSIIFIGGIIFTIVVNEWILKNIFDRTRPIPNNWWIKVSSSSFPSGHSACASFMYSYLIFIVSKFNFNSKTRKILYATFVLLICMVMVSRMVLGVHYFSDVCAGACVGLVISSIMIVIYNVVERYSL